MKNKKINFNMKKCKYILEDFYNPRTAEYDYFLTIIKGDRSVQFTIDKKTYEYMKGWEI